MLATCRRADDGGHAPLSEDDRRDRLDRAIEAGARLVDIEHDAPFRDEIQSAAHRAHAHIVVSHHDTAGTPSVDEMLDTLAGMQDGADVVKLATAADTREDVNRLLEAALQAPRLGTPFALMGLQDTLLRGLAGPLGMSLVYAATEDPLAPGQLPAKLQARLPKRPPAPDGHEDYVLLGHPVSHSLSPPMQNAAFRHLGEPARYRLADVPPKKLDATLEGMAAMGTRGGNTTAPHKQALFDACDEVTDHAQACQAVNTFRYRDGRLQGHMTDGIGLVDALAAHDEDLRERRVLLIGAGGTGKAAAHALTRAGAELVIANRTPETAKRLADREGATAVPLQEPALADAIHDETLLVNATPVDPPVPDAALPNVIVFDANYGPRAKLAHRARGQAARVLDGLSLLTHQGLASLSYWLDRDVDEDILNVMTTAARTAALEHTLQQGGPP